MKLAVLACAALLASTALAHVARADDKPSSDKPSTERSSTDKPTASSASKEERVVARARELLDRARSLDEAAALDDKTAADVAARLPNLRIAAKAARDRVSRMKETDPNHESLLARAEDLEVDVAVSEAEASVKKRAAADDRRVARDLRARAMRVLRKGTLDEEALSVGPCDPPFRYTWDGRKVYRIECLK
jgi:hypothetical protein